MCALAAAAGAGLRSTAAPFFFARRLVARATPSLNCVLKAVADHYPNAEKGQMAARP